RARSALPQLPVVTPLPLDDYDRDFFGPPWTDVDGNGCDTRNDVLRTWLTDTELDPVAQCVVASGTLADPYTGHVIDFPAARRPVSPYRSTTWWRWRTPGARVLRTGLPRWPCSSRTTRPTWSRSMAR